ncbi:hypothetical protein E4U60_004658 [Claviceps pazoutovae]|uniref:Uncharacterized protein n=1 Tax=Claviceps pazoutovae TaxID=1649127 RepID=A0A9P7SJ69_9HYPO|nr:hypothetical protein E4U60_004658 [Claviceps pazoutovae]
MDFMDVMLINTLWKMVPYDNMTAMSAAESPTSKSIPSSEPRPYHDKHLDASLEARALTMTTLSQRKT